MTFLHSLGGQSAGGNMATGLETGVAAAIAQKLKIAMPEDVEYHLPVLPKLPDYHDVKKDLLDLSEQAYRMQSESFLVIFSNNFFNPRD